MIEMFSSMLELDMLHVWMIEWLSMFMCMYVNIHDICVFIMMIGVFEMIK